ncbi:ATP-dependent DNA helicase PIF1 [Daktulosphaira vitifoliae]|uniref:ATP-dependent DNA helicase PIF1 n=1 Tax=Daktulosphaira vitifoliae TaxID=58002 RepID=UPI0021A9CE56|nr:ATP-dependent DNA helicase PIF1 [Daktulosphaira vitifoliae]
MSLLCTCNIEWLNDQGIVLKRFKSTSAKLALTRNDFRDIYLDVSADKNVGQRFLLKDISVHKRFLCDGKASIHFKNEKVMMMLSNAPVTQLTEFLKLLFVKVTGRKDSPQIKTRERLLAVKRSVTQEISPINAKDVSRISVSDKTENISTNKRKLDDDLKKEVIKKNYLMSHKDKLSKEQLDVVNAVNSKHNIFFTGSAGTGKSFLLRYIVSTLPPDVTMVTASTGASACLIGGVTLHSFAGIGTGECTIEKGIQMASKSPYVQTWRKCKTLIIDEISMVDGEYFEKLDKVAKAVRGCDNQPFGGIKLVLCGDFLQLPPVKQTKYRFCFQTITWVNCRFQCFNLKTVHRQTDDSFIQILNDLRIGKISPDTASILKSTATNSLEQNGIVPTRLCCRTLDAQMINKKKLTDLPGVESKFESFDSGSSKILDDLTPVEKTIILKPGAQVMLLKNISVNSGLVNGARGIVKQFDKNGSPIVQFKNGFKVAIKSEKWIIKTPTGQFLSRQQLPLKLAWAFSIHKSQGLTLDCVEISLGRVFEAGQAYVALSRAKSLKSLKIIDFDTKYVWANPDVLTFYEKLDKIINYSTVYALGKKIDT